MGRSQDLDIIYTCIESLTRDGRESSMDYKLSGILCPRGSVEAEVIDELKPQGPNEIYIPKTACSVFNSTNIEYILRNLGIQFLIITGALTNQCVESAVRDAADRGFMVQTCEDACVARSAREHQAG